MAMREVKEAEFVPFLKPKEVFAKIGDRFLGVFVREEPSANIQDATDYIFDAMVGGAKTRVKFTYKGQLKKQVDSASMTAGTLFSQQLKGERNIGKESPMKTYKIGVDDAWNGKALPPNGPNVAFPAQASTTEDVPADPTEDAPF